jgi:hypothetical protein
MSVAIKLEQMTVADKISTMEYLWDDLSRHASESLSPAWHVDLLMQREEGVSVGEAQFLDWEQAKKKIRESLQ